MILCLDSGNTRLKWGLADPQGRLFANGAVMQSALGELLEQLEEHPVPVRAVGSNVSSAQQAQRIEALLGMPIEWLVPAAAMAGVKNGYARPEQLGADRWAGLIAVRAMHAGPALIVSAGTATTVDMLTEGGEFRGGVILPGIDLMHRALAQNTANLPLAEADYMPFPDTTANAIATGVLDAQAGAIHRLFDRLPGAGKKCFIGGGAADRIIPLLDMPLVRIDDLVLRGLAHLAMNPA